MRGRQGLFGDHQGRFCAERRCIATADDEARVRGRETPVIATNLPDAPTYTRAHGSKGKNG